jgi:hypothetical protein
LLSGFEAFGVDGGTGPEQYVWDGSKMHLADHMDAVEVAIHDGGLSLVLCIHPQKGTGVKW